MSHIEYDGALAQAIVDTIREPLLVLDEELRVVAASRSFYLTFKTEKACTEGVPLADLGHGAWDIPALSAQLKAIAIDQSVLEDFEVVLHSPELGERFMCLNARKVFYERGDHATILLAIEDITARRNAQRECDQLLHEKDLLLQEMQHRVANSLQIIASILLMKARSVNSEETRTHLHDAHKRVLAVAAVQKHLRAGAANEVIEMKPYLEQLCASLAGSMIGDGGNVSIRTKIDESGMKASDAVSVGLIVTELVINSLKYAFPKPKPNDAIVVIYSASASAWRLKVCDNGCGKDETGVAPTKQGLGTSIVAALADQLQAKIDAVSTPKGMSVSLVNGAFQPALSAL